MRQSDPTNDGASDTNQTLTHQPDGQSSMLPVEFATKKIEKISQVLYVLTSHLSIEEPFRRSVREKALRLVDDLYDYTNEFSPQPTKLNQLIQHKFRELDATLKVGLRAGLLSEMNYEVVSNEMLNLVKFAQEKLSQAPAKLQHDIFAGLASVTSAVQDDLSVSTNRINTALSSTDYADITDRQSHSNSGNTSNLDSDYYRANKFSAPIDENTTGNEKATQSAQASNPTNNKSTNTTRRRHGRNHSKRRRAILELFKETDEITITDVQAVIEGCSQKTMQRELKAMVENDLLIKKGKRRWSSYVLHDDVDLANELDL